MSEFAVVIPARYASRRLPGKPLRTIAGKPMLQHVYERASESSATEVVIATDDRRIADAAAKFSAENCMTSQEHKSGTDRLAEVARLKNWSDELIIVNVQGDEPLMPAELIDQCAHLLSDERADVGTLASRILSQEDFENPNIVKVLIDNDGFALYFSRAAIPFQSRQSSPELSRDSAFHHHGIYAYRYSVLKQIVSARRPTLEITEGLEQLRVLCIGMQIKVGIPVIRPGPGVDTEEDLAIAEQLLN